MDELIINIRKCTQINHYVEIVISLIGILGICFGMYYIVIELLADDASGMSFLFIVYAIVAIRIICHSIKKYKCRKHLMTDGKIIKAKFNKSEFRFGLNRHYNKYYIVAYYVEGITTYRFNCEVLDFETRGLTIFNEIKTKGIFPDIPILVQKGNYSNYEMQIYDFLNETLELNKEIVDTIRYF